VASRQGDERPSAVPIWDRPEPASRPTPTPLSRDAIVTAAIDLADGQGLPAVSVRNVAAALGAGPMRLYGYLSTKEDLHDLMVDRIYGEIELPARLGTDWRADLAAIARSTRRAGLRHPWLVSLMTGRPRQGPNTLRYLEGCYTALGRTGLPIDHVMIAAGTVTGYVFGALSNELGERGAEQASGLTETQWQQATGPYLHRQLATGRFPTLGRVVVEATHPEPDTVFEHGLAVTLAGVAALVRGELALPEPNATSG
jgi:AcrR family transcriptional regulator